MSPGAYLKLRREAAGRAVDATVLSADRLAAIEAGAAPDELELWALGHCFPFSIDVLCMLGRDMPVAVCRRCGCSEEDACIATVEDEVCGLVEGQPCHWVNADLCSQCAAQDRPLPEGLAA